MKYIYLITIITLAALTSACDSGPSVASASGNIDDYSLGTDTNCSSSHSKVGNTGTLTTFAHSVSGTVTIIDDCTIEITGFNYDGGGPQVYFYAGTNGNYTDANAFRFSQLLTGTSFNNKTIRLIIPNPKSLDSFNSLSVWCVDFNANFGDIIF